MKHRVIEIVCDWCAGSGVNVINEKCLLCGGTGLIQVDEEKLAERQQNKHLCETVKV